MYVSVCVCVLEREREREREKSDLLAALGRDAIGDTHGRDAPRLRADDVDLHHRQHVSKCVQHV